MNEFKTIMRVLWDSDGYGCIIEDWPPLVGFWANRLDADKRDVDEVLKWWLE